ncbi:transglutaminase-like domain-containing protein [Roseateles oligotrophus]|uniref:Transglutaminase family protein n=1 Tax=Roseateles oligotrophus TaxID=1769250 RepID=A0ABT2Y9F4_9BURK|nr:transglutaminase family protein [Roseateles oligotrophus]MCV2366929.1 transglutaminase family protein [Roseateles oligotrophus]
MLRLRFQLELSYEIEPPGCDFIFNLQAAQTPQQLLVSELLGNSQGLPSQSHLDPSTQNRYLRLRAGAGKLSLNYQATVDLDHVQTAPELLGEVAVADLPAAVLHYVYPSRYCQSDRLHRLAVQEFGHLPKGYGRVLAIRDWVRGRTSFLANSSTGTTTAVDTLVEQVGVCRDFAHLMIALCRALNMPARFATGIDYGLDLSLRAQDFHAYVEVYLGQRWYLFDPSGVAIPMALIRIGTGRDAADTAFATIFGGVRGAAPVIQIEAIANAGGQLMQPVHVTQGLSTA